MPETTRALESRWLGRVEFDAAWGLQREIASRREEVVLLLEHPAVYTIGKNGDARNVVDAGGIPVKRIDRGGDVTYHGPGQLVGYPILDLRRRRRGAREHVEGIERAIVGALGELGIEAFLKEGCVGVWTARGKVASLGIRVAGGMSMHGFALNVSNDLEPFRRIHPCGVPACAMTSVLAERGRAPGLEEAGALVAARLG
jgi:lipoyl(octanoyl) transferase